MATLERVFGVRTIMDSVTQNPDGVVREPLPATKLFQKGKKGEVRGNLAYFDRRKKRRRLAALRGRNDTPHEITPPDENEIAVGVYHTVEQHPFNPSELFVEKRGFGEPLLDNAPQRVMDAVDDLVSNARRSIELICAQILLSAGSAVTIDSTLIPNTNISGSIQYSDIQTQALGADWLKATTKILSGANQLKAAKKKLKDKGYRPGVLIYTDESARGLYGNNEVKDWAGAGSMPFNLDLIKDHLQGHDQASVKRGEDPFVGSKLNSIGGIEKWLEWDHGYDDEGNSDAFTKYFDDTKAVLLPTMDDIQNVLGWAEAPALIPTGPNVIGGGPEAANMISKKNGIVVYAYQELEYPHRIILVCQSHWVAYVRDGFGICTITGTTS